MTDIKYLNIGQPQPRIDGMEKATGEAKYTADLKMPRMLIGKLLGSPYPHAKILNIDLGKASALPGVKAVVTGADLRGQKYGPFRSRRDETGLARDKVRYIGDPVAAVAAVDEETALEALELIKIEYEELYMKNIRETFVPLGISISVMSKKVFVLPTISGRIISSAKDSPTPF
jgi:4-hydroxybenzoyl-CoA reductase subunit alpha